MLLAQDRHPAPQAELHPPPVAQTEHQIRAPVDARAGYDRFDAVDALSLGAFVLSQHPLGGPVLLPPVVSLTAEVGLIAVAALSARGGAVLAGPPARCLLDRPETLYADVAAKYIGFFVPDNLDIQTLFSHP